MGTAKIIQDNDTKEAQLNVRHWRQMTIKIKWEVRNEHLKHGDKQELYRLINTEGPHGGNTEGT